MDRSSKSTFITNLRFPRTRGDGPQRIVGGSKHVVFSPHTRGWTGYAAVLPHCEIVFPAHAGMDRNSLHFGILCPCFPRTRGDGPMATAFTTHAPTFSPHTRGWTAIPVYVYGFAEVFPAHAGMDRYLSSTDLSLSRFPRTRGDGPRAYRNGRMACGFSPHTRGWTVFQCRISFGFGVFPAHAGMDRNNGPSAPTPAGFPRTRGDGPATGAVIRTFTGFSPHTRGWTGTATRQHRLRPVFPAHAGMDRIPARCMVPWHRFPRTRGDGPTAAKKTPAKKPFSPHTRGWTVARGKASGGAPVFPAHAGMDRQSHEKSRMARRFPRTRGDGPCHWGRAPQGRTFSPHTRGWTGVEGFADVPGGVFPAHAGMDR